METPPTRPPLGAYVAYRLLDRRLHGEYRDWVAADILDRWYPARSIAARAVLLSMVWAVMWPLTGLGFAIGSGTWTPFPIGVFLGTIVVVMPMVGLAFWPWYAPRAWRRHVGVGEIPADAPSTRRPFGRLEARGTTND